MTSRDGAWPGAAVRIATAWLSRVRALVDAAHLAYLIQCVAAASGGMTSTPEPDRLAALQVENARLIALLESHGASWRQRATRWRSLCRRLAIGGPVDRLTPDPQCTPIPAAP